MTVYMAADIAKRLAKSDEFLRRRETILRTALEVYVRRMNEAADVAQKDYEAGQADPAVKEHQDTSMMTNFGLKHCAAMFRDSATSAEVAMTELMDLILGE
ncbi:hypothetical protein J7I97_16875 [Streptomyces sp. ISL-87]|uniref:hypothetical protein n=1 Tax=Streptomyces sp. ISL-87 TaxID=2819188 RepID=UPI001BE9333A|nr:hypothetical protein [Streptomyces sp. ISL-87]MBT2609901.1 hypothetical protein [Streptomyces sp. ISL-87]